MTLIAGHPKPSNWLHRINGGADEIRGQDDGEAMEERNIPAAPYTFQHNEIETLEEIERLTKLNN
jgi:hypothetical protein